MNFLYKIIGNSLSYFVADPLPAMNSASNESLWAKCWRLFSGNKKNADNPNVSAQEVGKDQMSSSCPQTLPQGEKHSANAVTPQVIEQKNEVPEGNQLEVNKAEYSQQFLDDRLVRAVQTANLDLASVCIAKGANVNQMCDNVYKAEKVSLLYCAILGAMRHNNKLITNNNKKIAKLLLNHPDIDVNQQSSKTAMAPLHLLGYDDYPLEIFQQLIAKPNIKLDIQDSLGHTVFHKMLCAMPDGSTLLYWDRKFISLKTQVDSLYEIQDNEGKTIFHYLGTYINSLFCIRHMFSYERGMKVNLNIQDHKGNTALHYAAQRSMGYYAQCLIDNGASPHIVNKDGETPVSIVQKNVVSWIEGDDNQDHHKQNDIEFTAINRNVKILNSMVPEVDSPDLLQNNTNEDAIPNQLTDYVIEVNNTVFSAKSARTDVSKSLASSDAGASDLEEGEIRPSSDENANDFNPYAPSVNFPADNSDKSSNASVLNFFTDSADFEDAMSDWWALCEGAESSNLLGGEGQLLLTQ